jgi:hypothetical protein
MTPTTFPRGKALRVFWVDSTQIAGWRYGDQIPVHIEKIITLGWVVNCSTEGIGMTTTIAESGSVLSSVMIPWVAVVHIQELNEWDRDSNLPENFIDF